MDAEIRIGADASDLERTAAAAKTAFDNAAKGIQGAFSTATQSIVRGLSDVVLAQGRVNFSQQIQSVREFESSTARMAVATGRGLEEVRRGAEAVGSEIGKRPAEVIAWENAVGRLTYNFKGAGEAIRGVAGLAASTNRSIEDYQDFAVTLANVGHVAGDSTHAIGVLTAQAERLHTSGGVAAFADQITALGDTISYFAVDTERDFEKVTALAGELGKGLSPAASTRVQASVMGSLASNPMEWSRYLGRDIYNEKGQIADPAKVLEDITNKIKRTYGGDARRMLMLQFGAEAGSALYRADFKEAAKISGLEPSGSPQDKLAQYLQTDAGKRDKANVELDKAARDLLGSSTALGRAADALQRFTSTHPIAGSFLAQLGGSAIPGLFGKGGLGGLPGKGVGGLARGSLGSLGGAARGLGAAGLVVAAGAAGYEVGSYLEDKYRLSDQLTASGTYDPNQLTRAAGLTTQSMIDAVTRQREASTANSLVEKVRQGFLTPQQASQQFLGFARVTEGKAKGMDPDAFAQALGKVLAGMKFEVKQAPDVPSNVTVQTSVSGAAGAQHGG